MEAQYFSNRNFELDTHVNIYVRNDLMLNLIKQTNKENKEIKVKKNIEKIWA